MKNYTVIIIGGGPSGISCSHHLKKHNIDHLILEKKDMLQTWKNERWDSFYLVTPNWMTNLPGVEGQIPYNNEFMSKDQIYEVLKAYLENIGPEYLDHVDVMAVKKVKAHYEVNTSKGDFTCEHVIVAAGLFNNPFTPDISKKLPKDIHQMHSINYHSPKDLIEGNTLVVGSGRSGVQIALEIRQLHSSEVYLSVGSLTPLPTIYRNINGVYWLNRLSGYHKGKAFLPYKFEDLQNDNIINKINQTLLNCQREGVQIVGRFTDVNEGKFIFADSLKNSLLTARQKLYEVEAKIDALIHDYNLVVDKAQVEFDFEEIDPHEHDPILSISIEDANIKNIIWCTGYRPDYAYLSLDILDDKGYPVFDEMGKTAENVYFCGMGLSVDKKEASSFGVGLYAVNESAERVVEQLILNLKK